LYEHQQSSEAINKLHDVHEESNNDFIIFWLPITLQ